MSNTFTVLADRGEAVPGVLEAKLVRMLSEAPGYPQDIARALGVAVDRVASALGVMAEAGLIEARDGSYGSWYLPRQAA
ncbi:winged helix-turn-helix domain-containing protein [Microbacterium atlanticum]|uniref:winged helix-turn-helix domain-containing protein n=1 Tax=Microbacterium atlanticum TaxID=2782168 RepID=UPI001886FFC3|nr:winged helix-turn-helix domain-containing protein [Microbacterium atlanticum]